MIQYVTLKYQYHLFPFKIGQDSNAGFALAEPKEFDR